MAAFALLLGEYLLISLLFDARVLLRREGLAPLLAYAGEAASIVALGATVALFMMWRTLAETLASLEVELESNERIWPKLLLHAAAYAVFLGATRWLFRADGPEASFAPAALLWGLTAIGVAASWLPLALPMRALVRLWPRIAGSASIGLLAAAVAWIAGKASAEIWYRTAPPTLAAVTAILRLVSNDVHVNRSTLELGTSRFGVYIAPECSGLEGIGLILVLLGAYVVSERKTLRFPHVFALFPLAVITTWCANALRIALLILVGSYVSPQIAVGGFHSKAGWVFFCAIAIGFVSWTRNSRWFSVSQPEDRDAQQDAAAAYLAPELVALAAALMTGLFTAGFDLFYPLRLVLVGSTLFVFRARYRELEFSVDWRSVVIGALVFGAWLLLARGADEAAVHSLRGGMAQLGSLGGNLWLVARFVGACVVVPISEELAFRGYLLRRLRARDFTAVDSRRVEWRSWLISAIAFGVLHHDWLAATVAGLGYALAQKQRGRVSDAIVAHAVTNGLLVLHAIALGQLRFFA